MGITNQKKKLSGCLLHKTGSPHPQINLWEHPQNFSFYGESICQNYDCYNKQNQIPETDLRFLLQQKDFTYGRIIADHNLIAVCTRIAIEYRISTLLILEKIINHLTENQLNISSFETPLHLKNYSGSELFSILGTLLSTETIVSLNPFDVSETGIALGEAMKRSLQLD